MAILVNVSKFAFVELWREHDIEKNLIDISKSETNCKIKLALIFLLHMAL